MEIDVVHVVVLFLFLGAQLGMQFDYELKKKVGNIPVFLCLVLVANIVTGYLNYKCINTNVDLYTVTFGYYPLYMISAIMGALFVLRISVRMNDLFCPVVSYMGKNTVHIYGLHALVLGVLNKILESTSICMMSGNELIVIDIILTLVTLTICMIGIIGTKKAWILVRNARIIDNRNR